MNAAQSLNFTKSPTLFMHYRKVLKGLHQNHETCLGLFKVTGIHFTVYIDDIYLQGASFDTCKERTVH